MPHKEIEYLEHKEFRKALSKLYQMGGQPKKRAERVQAVLGRLGRESNPFEGLHLTNHGESRIRHCRKYDLGDGYRLVTIQTEKACMFCFVGSHADVDRWIESHSGLTINRSAEGVLAPVYLSGDGADERIRRESSFAPGRLLDKLKPKHRQQLLDGVSRLVARSLLQLDETSTQEEIALIVEDISDPQRQKLTHDVVSLLLAADVLGAERRLGFENSDFVPIESLEEHEILNVRDGDEIRKIRVGSPEHRAWLTRFAQGAEYYEWMLFMHPEQEAVVSANFNGPAQLSGVSGSGKTCVVVKRAIRLTQTKANARVLILTLNRSLASLIDLLVQRASPSSAIASSITVKSFFELCQDLLREFEPANEKLYVETTWKLNEHLDEIFREFYRCWHNNDDARVLDRVHQGLMARGIWAESYIKEEFDWIRTALPASERTAYRTIDRVGRKVPLLEDWRAHILAGVEAWEKKMRAVGVIDYLGLTTALSCHLQRITPRYDAILVDEAQDFGTTELTIIRRLVAHGENDLFLCGDIAQHVLPKHRVLANAGIEVTGRTRTIRRNYRNSREILSAAYKVLVENLDETLMDSPDLQLLDPELANRSSNQPAVLRAASLAEEIAFSRSLVDDHLEAHPDHHCCIAFAGYSLHEVEMYGRSLSLPVLNGSKAPNESPLVLSDLEQTKGYEFNVMIIVNCCDGVMPPRGAPPEETFRHGCRLYVAMTRARDELYISYSGIPSEWLTRAKDKLAFMDWYDVMTLTERYIADPPRHLPEFIDIGDEDISALDGRQFLYTPHALGLSIDAQSRILDRVDGVGRQTADPASVRWADMRSLFWALEHSPTARRIFGPTVQDDIRKKLAPLLKPKN